MSVGVVVQPPGHGPGEFALARHVAFEPATRFDVEVGPALGLVAPFLVLDPPGPALSPPKVKVQVLPKIVLARGADAIRGIS